MDNAANELQAKRDELARVEKQISSQAMERSNLRPGPGYGDAKQRLTSSIYTLTVTSARLQREVKTLAAQHTASLQPKLL
jgi:hypothetical protein